MSNVTKRHELEIIRYAKNTVDPANKAVAQASARLRYEGINSATVAAFGETVTASGSAIKRLMEMAMEHPEDFVEGFDLEELKKLIDKL